MVGMGVGGAVGVLATPFARAAFGQLVPSRRKKLSGRLWHAFQGIGWLLFATFPSASRPVYFLSRPLSLTGSAALCSLLVFFLPWWFLPVRMYLQLLRRAGPGSKVLLQRPNIPLRAEQQAVYGVRSARIVGDSRMS